VVVLVSIELAIDSCETEQRIKSRPRVFALIGGTTANRYHVTKRKVERKSEVESGRFLRR
jgi:hypothetical protein